MSRQEKALEYPLTLNLQFPSKIRPHCVAFSESRNQDVLAIFAVDENNCLFSLMLHPDCFRRRAATEGGLDVDACKTHASSAFTFRTPHRLVAHSDELVVAALHDGGILKFERMKAHEGMLMAWRSCLNEADFN